MTRPSSRKIPGLKKMNPSENSIATRLLLVLLLFCAGWAQAQSAGQVINVSGPLFAIQGDGGKRVLSTGSLVNQGDTLVTEEKTYARVKFTDTGEIVLRPNTQLKVESYVFAQAEPKSDNVVFGLLKGALRSVTGLIGKRGNQDAYRLQTETATIGIRGTSFIAEYVPPDQTEAAVASADLPVPTFALLDAPLPLFALADTALITVTDVPIGYLTADTLPPLLLAQITPPTPGGGGLAAGLYVHVIDGIINLTNKGGSLNFSAGQFGYTASIIRPPVVVPVNPGIQFSPPPAFSSSVAPNSNSSAGSKPKTVDCEVR